MAGEIQYWVGDKGPYYLDTTREYVTDTDPADPAGSLYEISDDAPADSAAMRAFRASPVIPGDLTAMAQIRLDSKAVDPEEVLRLGDLAGELAQFIQHVSVADIDNPATELAALAGVAGTLIVVTQERDGPGLPDLVTLYSWETDAGAADPPFICAGSTGYWTARGGRYHWGRMYLGPNAWLEYDPATDMVEMWVGGVRRQGW